MYRLSIRAQRVVDRDALVVDFLGVADHPRHGAQPAGHPHRAGIGEGGQAALEHARIELVGLAVDVHEAAREMRAHQRKAVLHHAGDQLVDEAVLRAPQGGDIEPRGGEEVARIDRAAECGELNSTGAAACGRLEDLERRVELVADFTHGWTMADCEPVAHGHPCDRDSGRAALSLYSCLLSMRRRTNAKPCFRFTRYLPGISLMVRLGPARVEAAAGTGRMRRMSKILLAEDDTDMRRFLVKALQNAGFDVTSYDNGLSAYQRLREEPFELLLTDIVMPEMDGIELARRAAELDPDIKIMFITGFAAVALNADSTAPKHAKVLSKPIHLRDLVNEVQKMLAA